jgi:hypothetical protein
MLELNRLGEREGAALVQNLAGHATLAPSLVAEIVERTDGVPLFVEELTKGVLESADQETRVVAVLAASPGVQLAIPPALHASLTARLDRLGPAAKMKMRTEMATGTPDIETKSEIIEEYKSQLQMKVERYKASAQVQLEQYRSLRAEIMEYIRSMVQI